MNNAIIFCSLFVIPTLFGFVGTGDSAVVQECRQRNPDRENYSTFRTSIISPQNQSSNDFLVNMFHQIHSKDIIQELRSKYLHLEKYTISLEIQLKCRHITIKRHRPNSFQPIIQC